MDLHTAIFVSLMRLSPHRTDTETRDEREARMHVVADAINTATLRAACAGSFAVDGCKPVFSDRRTLAGLLIGKGRFETYFAQYVHEGRCADGPVGERCDMDRDGHERAHGPWQQWEIAIFPHSDWEKLQGSTPEATELAAWHAATLLAGSVSMCRTTFPGDNISAAIAGFSGSCTLRMAPAKIARQAQAVRKILATLPAE